jgi:hypothetical protein
MCETGCRSTKRRTGTKRCTSRRRRRRRMNRVRRRGASRGRLTTSEQKQYVEREIGEEMKHEKEKNDDRQREQK